MGVELYTVQYIADPTSFVAGSRRVEQSLLAVEAQANKTKAAVSGFAGGGGRSATTAAKNVDKLTAALNAVGPAASAAGTAAKSNLTGVGAAAGGANQHVAGLGSSMTGFIAAAAGLAVVTKSMQIFSQAAEDAKKHLNEGAQSGLDKRGKAREYAGLMGKNSVDDDTMKGLFHLAQAGMMSFDKALQFGSQFEGSVTAGRDKGHINAAQIASLKEETAAFASRVGLDEKTAGDLGGVIPMYVDMRHDEKGRELTDEQGVDLGMGQIAALQAGLQDGRGEVSILARKELATASGAIATGHIKDHAELGAFSRVASTIDTAQGSGTVYKRMSRLVNEGLGDGGEFLKKAGVADKVGDYEKLKALKTHVDAQQAAAPDPAAFDRGKYLQAQGFGNDEEVRAAVGFMKEFDVLTTARDKARKVAGDGRSVRAANQGFRASVEGQEREGAAIREAGEYEQTRKRQRLAAQRKAAYGQLMAEDKIDTTSSNVKAGFLDATLNNLNPNTEHESMVDDRVWANARAAAKAAGIEDKIRAADPRFLQMEEYVKDGTLVGSYGGQDPGKLDEFMNRFGPEIESKGVSINGKQVDVGVNPAEAAIQAKQRPAAGGVVKAQVNGAQQMAPVGQPAAAPAGAVAPAAGGAAAPRVASADGSALDKVAERLAHVAHLQGRAASGMLRSMSLPGSDLGGAVEPFRA